MIEVDELTKSYGTTRAIERIGFTARPGRVTALLGPNGAGKTTTLRILLGLSQPDAGRATIGGRPYRALGDPTRTVGALLEWDTFHPARSARVHLRALATLGGLAERRVEAVLDLVELGGAADRRIRTYSQGMRRRLGLAAALLGDPAVFVADEPQGGLDPQGMRWLRDRLRQLADDGRTVLVSSHLLAEVARVADDVVIVDRGRRVGSGPLTELVGAGEPGARLEELFLT
ncbi:MAG: ABC transporter ATP-binding protein, partial [Natronosporangium sp.]